MEPQSEVDPNTFKGTTIVTENKSIAHESMTNTTADQNAFIGKNKAVIDIENSVFDKTGDTTSDDNSNFHGQNAVVLGIDGSQINIKAVILHLILKALTQSLPLVKALLST